ncbi:MAG TPA: HAMP domain-containing sensor histidine kinase, partial [Candidatus Acidoferrum sp.]|nr:HAMP domain-containing sensor histidine kinase [Candidatus Acidoferrum sp.]
KGKPISLAARIVGGVILLDLLLTAILVAIGVFVARTELLSAFDVSLQSKALSVRALVRYDEDDTGVLIFDDTGLPPSSDPAHPDVFSVALADGKLLAHANAWAGLPQGTRYTPEGFARFRKDGVAFRGLVLQNIPILDREEEAGPPAKVTVVYAASLVDLRNRVFRAGLYLSAAGLALLLPMAWLTMWITRRSLSPLNDLAGRAGGISVKQWVFEAPPRAKSVPELAPLSEALETLVSRLHDSFARQREFTSDLAHELKTSVAIIKSSAQVLLQHPRSAAEYEAGLEGLLGDCERMESLVERMLRLARIEQLSEEGKRTQLPETDLRATCEAAVSRLAGIAAAKRIHIQLDAAGNPQLRADPEDLELVWVNLLDNAVRHSALGGNVTLRLRESPDGQALLSVEDSGGGIWPEDLPHVFDRFRRGGDSRSQLSDGYGLGLAICKAIVEAYQGSIDIKSEPGKGTSVLVQIPVATQRSPA